jgi:hypothetical protein
MKYRMTVHDEINDIWMLEKRFLFIFWRIIGIGRKNLVKEQLDIRNKNDN